MSIRREMLQAAGRAPALLRERRDAVVGFVRSRLNPDGGFQDRRGNTDLYYTVFGIECLAALAEELPAGVLAEYLRAFAGGEGLDLVHLTCLARCWSALPAQQPDDGTCPEILGRIEGCRSADGGYGRTAAAGSGTAYACFLALGAYQDLAAEIPDPEGLPRCLESLRTADGAYANQPGSPVGLTASTAAAVTVMRQLGRPADPATAEWLLARCGCSGGFVAAPAVPAADLLATATALHALAAMGVALDHVRDSCIRFVEALWSDEGGFRAHPLDPTAADCEYTYYGLLALGHLAS